MMRCEFSNWGMRCTLPAGDHSEQHCPGATEGEVCYCGRRRCEHVE